VRARSVLVLLIPMLIGVGTKQERLIEQLQVFDRDASLVHKNSGPGTPRHFAFLANERESEGGVMLSYLVRHSVDYAYGKSGENHRPERGVFCPEFVSLFPGNVSADTERPLISWKDGETSKSVVRTLFFLDLFHVCPRWSGLEEWKDSECGSPADISYDEIKSYMSAVYTVIEVLDNIYISCNPRAAFCAHLVQLAAHCSSLICQGGDGSIRFAQRGKSVSMLLIGSTSRFANLPTRESGNNERSSSERPSYEGENLRPFNKFGLVGGVTTLLLGTVMMGKAFEIFFFLDERPHGLPLVIFGVFISLICIVLGTFLIAEMT
jgi:hypothetical protein